jgi:hypothetical protein
MEARRGSYGVLMENSGAKRQLVRPRRRWGNNIKILSRFF